MRELDCDFCGARAAGAYEVLPAELDPAPDEQVRVVLCGNCRDTLDAVTAPLLARLGVGERGPDPADDPAQSTLESGTATDADGGPEDDAQASARAENPVSPADDAVIIDSGARPPRAAAEEGERERVDASDVAAERKATAAEGAAAADAEADGSDDGEEPEATGDDSAGGDPADGDPTDGGEPTVRQYAEEPEEFRTVMRLLNNREFPVDRTEVVDLASGAYELEAAHVEEIIDHAVERGILAEQNGTLTKG